jgi:hypothetical protein
MQKNQQRESLERRLSAIDVPEERYRADIDLHDRSLAFSAELLRLTLAGITVVGFVVAQFPEPTRRIVFDDSVIKGLLAGSLVAFAVSAGFALLHRFYAGGAAFHHLEVIKLLLLDDAAHEDRLEHALTQRTALFLRCHRFLTLASGLLILGAALVGGAFIRLLFA